MMKLFCENFCKKNFITDVCQGLKYDTVAYCKNDFI